jgi:hypothetical protein
MTQLTLPVIAAIFRLVVRHRRDPAGRALGGPAGRGGAWQGAARRGAAVGAGRGGDHHLARRCRAVGRLCGFPRALAIWGWIEMAFLTGIIAGPERRECPPGLEGSARFARAWSTVSHHEVALLAGLVLIVVATTGGANQVALWTYLILFLARISAKLNLFFGVPRINMEFVPARLVHLKSYFRRGPVTAAFPSGDHRAQLFGGLLSRTAADGGHPRPAGRIRPAHGADRACPSGTLADGHPSAGRETLALDVARAQKPASRRKTLTWILTPSSTNSSTA